MGSPRAWLLNFEADFELAQPGGFTPDRGLRARLEALRHRHAERVLRCGDLWITEEQLAAPAPAARWQGLEGRAWCPTAGALAQLRRLGLRLPAAPSMEVLRCVNDRAFSASFGQNLPGACFCEDLEELEGRLAQPSPSGAWICKRAFGASGRGQLRLRREGLGESQRAWLAASLRQGGVQLEPLVDVELEFVTHGWLDPEGESVVAAPCVMVCDAQGAWVETRPARPKEIEAREGEGLLEEARLVAAELGRLGYFGPFGVDGFRWRDAGGVTRLQTRSEVNGRYTMGWRVSFPEH